MKLLGKLIFYVLSNAIALLLTAELVVGFSFSGDITSLLLAALIFTAFNILLKPVLKLIFGPLIVLTFGLFAIVINAIVVYSLDLVMEQITIEGLIPLIVATIIFGVINALISFSGKAAYK